MVIDALANCLTCIREPRFYETERGFQGELLSLLRAALPECRLPGDPIVEQEYQKRLGIHGLAIRPDIIIHVPTQSGGIRRAGNWLACELKLAAGPHAAQEDFASLDALVRELDYAWTAFVNVGSGQTHASLYRGPYPNRLHWFAVQLSNGLPRVRHARMVEGRLVEEEV